jgi:hypothetical protein
MKAALAILLVLAGVAYANSETDYERAFKRGNELFDQGKWAASRAEYEAAFAIEPRTLAMFNIASTYYREGDLVNARLFYVKYLKLDGEKDAGPVQIARDRIAEIDASRPERPSPPSPTGYPREVIARPLTQPPGMPSALAGLALSTYDAANDDGARSTFTRYAVLAGGAYGITDRIEAGGELALPFDDASLGIAYAFATSTLADGVALRATGSIGFDGTLGARLGVPLRLRIVPRIAIVATEDQLVVNSDRAFARLPIGVGFQLSRMFYVTGSLRVVDAALRGGDTTYASYGALSLSITPADNFDIVTETRLSGDSVEVSAVLRIRI